MSFRKILNNIFSITYLRHQIVYRIFGIKIRVLKIPNASKEIQNLPVQNNKIVLRTFSSEYSCNVKYIANEIIKRKLPYELYWITHCPKSELKSEFPEELKVIEESSKESLKAYSTAKIWIENHRRVEFVKKGSCKKDNQVYIQTWHGSMGIKKIGKDSHSVFDKFIKYAEIDSTQMDYILSNSNWVSDLYKKTFTPDINILKIGHPRNDIFFSNIFELRENINRKYDIKGDTKICLYAPTWRNDLDMEYYNIDYKRLLVTLAENSNHNWCIFARMHPNMSKFEQDLVKNSKVIDVTDYADMQELLAVSDMLISDYSSCMFDFMLSRKPVFVFATDIEKYNTERGLYYPLESTPFPIATNNDEMVKNIQNFDYESYKTKVEEFLKEKGCIEDGHASERVVDLIEKIMKEDV